MDPSGRCVALPSCEPNQIPTFDGCESVGVEACGDGFREDPVEGCQPVLPSQSCTGSAFAYPGVTDCAAASCAAAPNAEGLETYYVGDYGAEAPNGTTPYASVAAALAAHPGKPLQLILGPGEYRENVRLEQRVILNGERCNEVRLVAANADLPVVTVTSAGSKSSINALDITGGRIGILVEAAAEVNVGRVSVHDIEGEGIVFDDASSGRVALSVVDRARGAGIVAYGSGPLRIEQTHVRATRERFSGGPAYGIALYASGRSPRDPNAEWYISQPTVATVSEVFVEGSAAAGIFIEGSNATIDGSVVRATNADRDGAGRGIEVRSRPAGEVPAELILRKSLIEASFDAGVFVDNARATFENVMIRDVGSEADPTDSRCIGNGVRVRANRVRPVPADPDVEILSSVVERTREAGVFVEGARAVVERTEIRDVAPSPCRGGSADGIAAHDITEQIA